MRETIDELKYYIYAYSDLDTHTPFYVGKERWSACLTYADTSQKSRIIQDLLKREKSKGGPIRGGCIFWNGIRSARNSGAVPRICVYDE